MRKLYSILAISILLSTQGLLLLSAPSYAEVPMNSPQSLLIAFDGFDDDSSDMSSDDSNADDTMDDGDSTSSGGGSGPAPGEDAPDSGFQAGYSQDNE
jgi:hypothetical protein